MKTENISTLKIHKLSKEQYQREQAAGNLAAGEIYLTLDEDSYDQIFTAIYGETTFSDIKNAYSEGKIVIAKCEDELYFLTSKLDNLNTNITFYNIAPYDMAQTTSIKKILCDANEGWSGPNSYSIETADNKTSSITAESTDAQYPSAKAVYDFINTVDLITPEDINTICEEFANLYIWKEYDKEPTNSKHYDLVNETSALNLAYKSVYNTTASYNEILYSTNLIIENGVAQLVNPTKVIFESITEENKSETDILKGKYIQIIRQSSSDIYYLPEDIVISYGWQMGTEYRYYVAGNSGHQKVVPNTTLLGYRLSTSLNEFPRGGVASTTGYYYTGGNRIGDMLCGDGSYSISASDKQEIAQSAASIVDSNLLTLIGNEVSQ